MLSPSSSLLKESSKNHKFAIKQTNSFPNFIEKRLEKSFFTRSDSSLKSTKVPFHYYKKKKKKVEDYVKETLEIYKYLQPKLSSKEDIKIWKEKENLKKYKLQLNTTENILDTNLIKRKTFSSNGAISNILKKYIHNNQNHVNYRVCQSFLVYPLELKPLSNLAQLKSTNTHMRNSNYYELQPNPENIARDFDYNESGSQNTHSTRAGARRESSILWSEKEDPAEVNPDVYRSFLGPTPDESILAGLQTVIEMVGSRNCTCCSRSQSRTQCQVQSAYKLRKASKNGSLPRDEESKANIPTKYKQSDGTFSNTTQVVNQLQYDVNPYKKVPRKTSPSANGEEYYNGSPPIAVSLVPGPSFSSQFKKDNIPLEIQHDYRDDYNENTPLSPMTSFQYDYNNEMKKKDDCMQEERRAYEDYYNEENLIAQAQMYNAMRREKKKRKPHQVINDLNYTAAPVAMSEVDPFGPTRSRSKSQKNKRGSILKRESTSIFDQLNQPKSEKSQIEPGTIFLDPMEQLSEARESTEEVMVESPEPQTLYATNPNKELSAHNFPAVEIKSCNKPCKTCKSASVGPDAKPCDYLTSVDSSNNEPQRNQPQQSGKSETTKSGKSTNKVGSCPNCACEDKDERAKTCPAASGKTDDTAQTGVISHKCFPDTCGDTTTNACEVRYAMTIISKFDKYTTYEVLKSSLIKPKNIKNVTEGVFVVRRPVNK